MESSRAYGPSVWRMGVTSRLPKPSQKSDGQGYQTTERGVVSKMAENDLNRIETWCLAAQVIGFNELAKQQETLGQKVFCRLARNSAEAELRKLGVQWEITQDKVVLTLKDHVPHIEFTDNDIELMRAEVARRDQRP